MEIRSDFKGVSDLLERLLIYSKEFVIYNKKEWGYLKNQEDFNLVYALTNDIRFPLEKVYEQGRNLAVSMIYLLQGFNDVGAYPTFASYVNHIETSVPKHLEESENIIVRAERIISDMDTYPWAVEQMIYLHKNQVNILRGLEDWIHRAKNTKLYREESGEFNPSPEEGTAEGATIYRYSTTFQGPVGQAQVQQDTHSSTQSIEMSQLDFSSLFKFLEKIKNEMSELEIQSEIKRELSSEIATLEAQAKSPKPKYSIISESLSTIRRILEGAGGGVAGQLLLQLGSFFM